MTDAAPPEEPEDPLDRLADILGDASRRLDEIARDLAAVAEVVREALGEIRAVIHDGDDPEPDEEPLP